MFCIFVSSSFFLPLFICSHDISQRGNQFRPVIIESVSVQYSDFYKRQEIIILIIVTFIFLCSSSSEKDLYSVFSRLERLIISSGCSIELFSRYPTGNSVVSKVKDTFFHSRLDDFSPRSEWLVCHPRIHSPCCSRFSSKDACPIVW